MGAKISAQSRRVSSNGILIVFPTGSKIKDTSGLLEGNYSDGRKIATIKDLEDAKAKKEALQNAIKDWLSAIEK